MRSVYDIGDELYALPPADFTAARDTFVAEAKNTGDRAAASDLGALKRPSVSAWLVNLVALRAPETLQDLIDLGATIRGAQGSVPPAQLRDLSAQRRKALDVAVARAQTLAADTGATAPSRQHVTEAESTLSAAMADDDVAAQVRTGRLLKAMSYSGFGQEGLGGFGPVPRAGAASSRAGSTPSSTPTATRRRSDVASDDGAVAEQHRAAAERRAAAEAKLADAEASLTGAVSAERAANDLAGQLTAEINELRERLDVAQRDARLARQHRMTAEREVASTQRRLDRTE